MSSKLLRTCLLLPVLAILGGCQMVVMNPAGDIAVQQRDLIVVSTILMLIIIIPVMALTAFFAWKYRQGNKSADYAPDWHHSTKLEVVIWSAPLAIIIALGAITWVTTHTLDPYRPLDRIAEGQAIPADVKPLTVEVVALDWKWLFIYPEQGIASVNELAAPVNTPINFKITSSGVMNSFFIPALAGQVYAMGGMETKLHAVINKPGDFEGFSANYSGAGFSDMRFTFKGVSQADFDSWVAKVKSDSTGLSRDNYLTLAKPSEREPVHYYGTVDNSLFSAIVNNCAEPGRMCMSDMAAIDAMGGGGMAGIYNVVNRDLNDKLMPGRKPVPVLDGDVAASTVKSYVGSLCTPTGQGAGGSLTQANYSKPVEGAALAPAASAL
ncbi:ubiquinol oxidase subunit II [Radicibacter daui]|uniref:ubiquinol oxidase subunit II n=1 Tax=Radicibacter daui TaxID=3064829 RepID=UPI004046FD8F